MSDDKDDTADGPTYRQRAENYAFANPHSFTAYVLLAISVVGFVIGAAVTYGLIVPMMYQWPLDSIAQEVTLNPRMCMYPPNFVEQISMNGFSIKFTQQAAYDLLDQPLTVNQYSTQSFTYRSRLENVTAIARENWAEYITPEIWTEMLAEVPLVLTTGFPNYGSDWAYSGACAKKNRKQMTGCVYTFNMEEEMKSLSDNTFFHEYAHPLQKGLNPDGAIQKAITAAFGNVRSLNVQDMPKYVNQPMNDQSIAGGFWYSYKDMKEYFAVLSAGYLQSGKFDTYFHTWPANRTALANEDPQGYTAVNEAWTMSASQLEEEQAACYSDWNVDIDWFAFVWAGSIFFPWMFYIPLMALAWNYGWYWYGQPTSDIDREQVDTEDNDNIELSDSLVKTADADADANAIQGEVEVETSV